MKASSSLITMSILVHEDVPGSELSALYVFSYSSSKHSLPGGEGALALLEEGDPQRPSECLVTWLVKGTAEAAVLLQVRARNGSAQEQGPVCPLHGHPRCLVQCQAHSRCSKC